MTPTLELIAEKFDRLNNLCFGGQLPRPAIKLSRAKTFVGMMTYKRDRSDFCLRISTMFDLEEEELEDVILHEMIHYHIAYRRLHDTSSHGKLFRHYMNDLNSRFGRHITISHRSTPAQRMKAPLRRRRIRTVAFVEFRDGRTGVKVLPSRQESVARYYNSVSRHPDVSSVRLFRTNNPYFERFPCSSALRVAIVGRDELERELGLSTS